MEQPPQRGHRLLPVLGVMGGCLTLCCGGISSCGTIGLIAAGRSLFTEERMEAEKEEIKRHPSTQGDLAQDSPATCGVTNEETSTTIHCGEESAPEHVAVEIKDGTLSVRAAFQTWDEHGAVRMETVEVTSDQIGPGLALKGKANWGKNVTQDFSLGSSSRAAQNWLASLTCQVNPDQYSVHCEGEERVAVDVYSPNIVEIRGPSLGRKRAYVDLSVTSTQDSQPHVIFATHPNGTPVCGEVAVLTKSKKETKSSTIASK